MNADIMSLSNELIYDNMLTAGSDAILNRRYTAMKDDPQLY